MLIASYFLYLFVVEKLIQVLFGQIFAEKRPHIIFHHSSGGRLMLNIGLGASRMMPCSLDHLVLTLVRGTHHCSLLHLIYKKINK